MTQPPVTSWMRRLPHRPVARPAPVAPPPTPPPTPTPTPPRAEVREAGLTRLSPSAPPRWPAPATRAPALTLIPPRGVVGAVTLDADDPVVRLDAVQSGIGPLEIRGADRVAWEDVEDRGGVLATAGASTGDDVPAPGNRPVVAELDGAVVVNLRHVRTVRRLLVDAAADTAVIVTAAMGGTVRAADPDQRVRISVVVVDGRLELRAEYGLPDDWRAALTAMGWSPLASISR